MGLTHWLGLGVLPGELPGVFLPLEADLGGFDGE